MSNGLNTAKAIVFLLFVYALFAISVVFLLTITVSCTSVSQSAQFNAEDRQDGSCYATMGGIRGYCNAIDDQELETNCQYDHNSTGSYKVCNETH